MKFTHADYLAQGLIPPCPRAIYIPSSSPFSAGDCYAPDDSTELFVAWEQRCMATGGVYSTRLWWVPQSELQTHRSSCI